MHLGRSPGNWSRSLRRAAERLSPVRIKKTSHWGVRRTQGQGVPAQRPPTPTPRQAWGEAGLRERPTILPPKISFQPTPREALRDSQPPTDGQKNYSEGHPLPGGQSRDSPPSRSLGLRSSCSFSWFLPASEAARLRGRTQVSLPGSRPEGAAFSGPRALG